METFELVGLVALAIAVTLAATHALGRAVGRIRQPVVVGEIIAGILLGPTLLGAFPGDPSAALFTDEVVEVLEHLAKLGVVLYMFLVGLDLNVAALRNRGRNVVTISASSLVFPFALGALLGASLYGAHDIVDGARVDELAFVLFMGTATAMTAFPVLARILTESGLHRHELGVLALTCAAVLDGLGWLLLAGVLAIVSSSGAFDLVRIVAEAALFAGVLFAVVRPLLRRLCARQGEGGSLVFVVVVVGLALLSAAATEAIGLHALIGAVAFGAAFPRDSRPDLLERVHRRIAPGTLYLLLPLFFLLPGLNINLREIGVTGAAEIAAIVLVACVGKFVGAGGATRACGYPWRESAVMGTLMNTRGLIELVVLNVGASVGVLDGELYGFMVLMALVTTMMTGPLLHSLYSPWMSDARAHRPAVGLRPRSSDRLAPATKSD